MRTPLFGPRRAALLVASAMLIAQAASADDITVLTSGAFTAAHIELGPRYERATNTKVVTGATSMGTGAGSILSRLQRGDPADVVIVAGDSLDELITSGLVLAGSRVDLARSSIGMAVKAGAPRPDISTVDAFRRTLLAAQSIAYSASVSGVYLTTELFQRLGIAGQVLGKSRRIEGERVGNVVARGEAEIGFQQISELLPVAGIDYVGPLPGDTQRVTMFSAGVAAGSKQPEAARAFIRFLASPEAAAAIAKTGLEPVARAPSIQQAASPQPPSTGRPPTRADILRGEYGRYRANNDLLFYDLDVRVDPEKKVISGRNTIRFRMLAGDTRIQLDLYANLDVDKILLHGPELKFGPTTSSVGRNFSSGGATPLKYTRELNTVFVDFPETLEAGGVYSIDVHYSGSPRETGRFGGFTFGKDPSGRHWITTACEGQGASIWWPNKDQWRDEPDEGMELSVAVPSDLVDVSNGKFLGKTDLGDGYTRWDWRVHYPINSYNVSVNAGNYVHFADRIGDLPLDFYVLPGSLDKAKRQFAQAKPMIQAYQKIFGEYPFAKDGYKLIEVPYSGMEHQSAVTYGNRFANGYLERDWTGVGVSLKFDFIIIHESAHEWFGNAVSAADVSDMWIQEGWTTYLENVYVEQVFGYDDALKYVNGYKSKVRNGEPIITQRGIHRTPNQDQYFKGALFLHTLRSVVNDDARWWKLLGDVYRQFKYRNIMTEDLVGFVNAQLGQDLTPIFDQYLRRAEPPMLELAFNETEGTLAYRWKADERAFAMPIRVGSQAPSTSLGTRNWQIIQPTTAWKTMPNTIRKADFEVATDLYYVHVAKE